MKTFLLFIIILASNSFLVAQENFQTFHSAGFKVKCGCQFYVNNLFITMAKQNGINNILFAYICGENKESSELGVANNINITDESASYSRISPSNYDYFEKKFLEAYAKNLSNAGFTYNYISYKGVTALEYNFDQLGLPTKALFFLKNKKSYLIQSGSRTNLTSKFNLLKYSFEFL